MTLDSNGDIPRTRQRLATAAGTIAYYSLASLAGAEGLDLARLPYTIKILLENVLRQADRGDVTRDDILALARWSPGSSGHRVVPFLPARVLLQDFTGVPAVVDLAAMRAAVQRVGGDPARINPLVPADLVIDHSVQVDLFGSTLAFEGNVELEYTRNAERYALLRWAQGAFDGFRVVPPGTGICHQVNLEYLAPVVATREVGGETLAYPDTLVGTDSHTTMINGLGVLGWGVGGIEAEAALLGQPMEMLTPEVIGFRFTGELPEGATATDLVLTVTQILRQRSVVGKLVEFTGSGLSRLSLADRATLANMAPEYGATCGFFPVDDETLRYLRLTGRDEAHVELVEAYCKAQGLFRTDEAPLPHFTELIDLDLATVEPSVAGPRRPQDRVPLPHVKDNFRTAFSSYVDAASRTGGGAGPAARGAAVTEAGGSAATAVVAEGEDELDHGSVVIAAITSCTNTSNPAVMVGAGLLAKKAVERGLSVPVTVKPSLAPGSKVVTDYLNLAGLTPYLEQLGFYLVGYGCTTCIGNSGPLPEPVSEEIAERGLAVVAVLSGNRNFEGRIHPQVRAQYLASPPLVVAYALAGTVNIDLTTEPLGRDGAGKPVFLSDVWPTMEEIKATLHSALTPELFQRQYASVFEGDDRWKLLPAPTGTLFDFDPNSTYVQEPPFFRDLAPEPRALTAIRGARVLAILGDSVTTDHISPAGSIPKEGPAGQYLQSFGVTPRDFNSFGARRGNHEVMMRGTFGNVRLRNQLTPDREGDWTAHQPEGTVMRIYDAAMRYQEEGTPLVVLAGKEYGTGSSRDWAAKGTVLLGVRVVIARSFERIHRSNLVGMGALPLQFRDGESRESLGLTGRESFDFLGLDGELRPGQEVQVRATAPDGRVVSFVTTARLDTPTDARYYRNGGILATVLRDMLAEG